MARLSVLSRCAVLFCTLSAVIDAPAAGAATTDAAIDLSQPLSLAQCIRMAEDSAPVTLSQRAQQIDADAMVQAARTPQNPSVSYVAQDLGLSGASGPLLLHQAMIGFAPLAALLRIQESRAACAGRNQALAAAQEQIWQLRGAVGQAFYDLLLLEKLQRVEAEAARLAAQLVVEAQARKRHGDASGLDVVRAQAEALDAARLADSSAHQLTLAQRAFVTLIGGDAAQRGLRLLEDLATLDLLPSSIAAELAQLSTQDEQAARDALVRLAKRHRPELRQTAAEQQQAHELIRLSTLRALPLADVQVAGGVRSSIAGVGGVLAIAGSLPLFDWNLPARHRAAAQSLRAQAKQRALEQQIALDVQNSWADYHKARELRAQFALPLCQLRERALATVRTQYAEGIASFQDVVQTARDLFAAQRALYQIERDAWSARWRLAIATATW